MGNLDLCGSDRTKTGALRILRRYEALRACKVCSGAVPRLAMRHHCLFLFARESWSRAVGGHVPTTRTRHDTDKNLHHRLFPASGSYANPTNCDVLKHQEKELGPPMGTLLFPVPESRQQARHLPLFPIEMSKVPTYPLARCSGISLLVMLLVYVHVYTLGPSAMMST